mmetsp:Transcript_62496/g.162157  ORF Transcript_62496/g.162157 Transcript_62496/m.162157 type:complete len:168 (-) Transcript_62496:250-753(-)
MLEDLHAWCGPARRRWEADPLDLHGSREHIHFSAKYEPVPASIGYSAGGGMNAWIPMGGAGTGLNLVNAAPTLKALLRFVPALTSMSHVRSQVRAVSVPRIWGTRAPCVRRSATSAAEPETSMTCPESEEAWNMLVQVAVLLLSRCGLVAVIWRCSIFPGFWGAILD